MSALPNYEPYLYSSSTIEDFRDRYCTTLQLGGFEANNLKSVIDEYFVEESHEFQKFTEKTKEQIFEQVSQFSPASFKLKGRKKAYLSYLDKLIRKTPNISTDDTYAIRLIVSSKEIGIVTATDTCFLIAKTIMDFCVRQNGWKAIPDMCKDTGNIPKEIIEQIYIPLSTPEYLMEYNPYMKNYIATPKSNGYQTIQFSLRAPLKNSCQSLEIQIRTDLADNYAEHGAASHDGNYKAPYSQVYDLTRIHIDGFVYDCETRSILKDSPGLLIPHALGEELVFIR